MKSKALLTCVNLTFPLGVHAYATKKNTNAFRSPISDMNFELISDRPNDFLPLRPGYGSFSASRIPKRCDTSWLRRRNEQEDEENELKKVPYKRSPEITKPHEPEKEFKLEFEPDEEAENYISDDDDEPSMSSVLYGSSGNLFSCSRTSIRPSDNDKMATLRHHTTTNNNNHVSPIKKNTIKTRKEFRLNFEPDSVAESLTEDRSLLSANPLYSSAPSLLDMTSQRSARPRNKKSHIAYAIECMSVQGSNHSSTVSTVTDVYSESAPSKASSDNRRKSRKDQKEKKSSTDVKKTKEVKKMDKSKRKKEKKSTKTAKIPKTIMVPTSDESSGEDSSSADNLEDVVEQLQRMNASWASLSYDEKTSKLKVRAATTISHGYLRPPEFLPLLPKESIPSRRIHAKKDVSWIK